MNLTGYVGGEKIIASAKLSVRNPYNGTLVGTVDLAERAHTEKAICAGLACDRGLTRFHRSEILDRTRERLANRREEFAQLITAEAGLCLRETRYEVGRALDVLRFASMEALRDDGQIFSADISP